jgi:hypothetical protein
MGGQASREQEGREPLEVTLLSELVVEGAEGLLRGLLEAEVALPDGSVYGRVKELYYGRDLTVTAATVERRDGLLVKVPAERLVLLPAERRLVLLKPRQLFISEAARLALRAAERLVEALSVKNPARRQLLVDSAKRDLEAALETLERREVELP